MSGTTAFDIIAAVISSGSLVTLIIFIVNRHDSRKDELTKVYDKLTEIQDESKKSDNYLEKKLKKLEKDIVRTQLLQLMQSYDSEDEHELMQVAEHYFSKEHLAANWYMTTKFNRFMQKNKIAKPEWFNK